MNQSQQWRVIWGICQHPRSSYCADYYVFLGLPHTIFFFINWFDVGKGRKRKQKKTKQHSEFSSILLILPCFFRDKCAPIAVPNKRRGKRFPPHSFLEKTSKVTRFSAKTHSRFPFSPRRFPFSIKIVRNDAKPTIQFYKLEAENTKISRKTSTYTLKI